MPGTTKRIRPPHTEAAIPPEQWNNFLLEFNIRHHGWLAQLETHDLVTEEIVFSQEMRLKSIELDLEDQENPRINVTVHDGNKVIKHILFRPSRLVLRSSTEKHKDTLQVETVNTETTVRFQLPAAAASM